MVGLMGDGEIGVRGRGDLVAEVEGMVMAGTARASFGLVARASMLITESMSIGR